MRFHTSYFNILLLAFTSLTSALPSPPTVYNGDGTPVKDPVPNALAQLVGLTNNGRDRSGKHGDPPEKYFHESTFHAHYDGRFASTIIPPDERLKHLRALIRTYLSTMHTLNAETWIMHGSLLGWWWNRKIMPWDSDLDVQVSESAIEYLARYHNMTIHRFQDVKVRGTNGVELGGKGGKKYLLEINPHYKNPSMKDTYNVIDARWIDVDTGLFIDITTLRRNTSEPDPEKMYCKDKHLYRSSQIFPLRDSVFEEVPVKIPYSYQDLLIEEYGKKSIVDTVFRKERHFFDQGKMEWLPMTKQMLKEEHDKEKAEDGKKPLFEQWAKKGPDRAKKPHRKLSGDDNGGGVGGSPTPGKAGEVHHPPGSANDF